MAKQKYIYAIMLVVSNKDESFSTEPVGVYTSMEDAKVYLKQLDDLAFKNNCVFDIIELELNKKPAIIDALKILKEQIIQRVEENVFELMKRGYVDQLVGDDGHFYYTITESGKKYLEKN